MDTPNIITDNNGNGNADYYTGLITSLILLLVIIVISQMFLFSVWDTLIVQPIEYVEAGFDYVSQIAFGKEQRTFPTKMIDQNPDGKYKHMITSISDVKFDANKMFLVNYMGDPKFKHVFDSEKERESEAQKARAYFKKQYGLSDTFLNLGMFELTVNPKIGYRAYYDHATKQYNQRMEDGGYVVYLPPYTRLTGRYGGKDGVVIHSSGVLAYGHYKIYDDDDNLVYKIIYTAPCPLQSVSRYDANYTPIDCDVEIIKAPNKKLVGLKGKAQGLSRNIKISGPEKSHILIKNIMTFYE